MTSLLTSWMKGWNEKFPPINLLNYPRKERRNMDISQKIYTSVCPICARERTYKTKQGYDKGLTKPCKSCSNSINRGGDGFKTKCKCGNPKYEKSSTLCLVCHNQRSLTYHMQTYRFKKYGVTRDWYEEEVKKGCAICKTPLEANSKVKRERGHIDHCHTTNKVRGVLCDLCNKGLGQFRDNTGFLKKAIKYLEENT